VRTDYGKVASVSVQNADAVATKFGYSLEELSIIPEGSNLGLSCGNPLALVHVQSGETVVDLGSGGGLDCFLASTKVGPSGKVYGIDMTPEMLEKTRANAAKRNITNVEFLQGDIEALPLPDAIADLVISNCVINLVPNKKKAFAEIFRVLKPGGRLAISDITLKKDFPPEIKSNVGMFSACFTGAMALNEVPAILKEAGFQGIIVNDAQVDLNAYKELGTGSGCCGSVPAAHPLTESLADIDFNEYATSAKILALK
jgi:SAM-dependent methyltransferase